MLERLRDGKRILAIDPASRSLGYAVLEGPDPDTLVDWGLKETRNNKQKKSLALVNDQIDRYDPDLILAEDPVGKGSRRCPRIRKLITNILQLASKHKIKTKRYSRRAVKKAFFENARGNKHQIATAIAARFPEMAPRLPPVRKPWMNEDPRMAMFNAVALAITYFEKTATPHQVASRDILVCAGQRASV